MKDEISQGHSRSPSRDPSRRRFLAATASAAGMVAMRPLSYGADLATAGRRKAAIIGHTGRGDFGHSHDLIFQNRAGMDLVAIADADANGLTKAMQRTGARRGYADYREMLVKEKPGLVAVTPRWTDQHYDMGLAALESGAHLYMEKPFTQSLDQADRSLAEAAARHLQITVAHQMRLAPGILHLKRRLEEGLIGDLLQIHVHGKQDRRAGGEDMIVLGTHLFDLVRFWAGDVHWCTARILQNGHPVTRQDIHEATENIGPIAGDDIEARFGCGKGVVVNYTSRGAYREMAGHWGMTLVGAKGEVRILMDMEPRIFVNLAKPRTDQGRGDDWERLDGDPTWDLPAGERGFEAANRRVVDDWLESIENDREPICSGRAAMKSLEMITAVFQAGLTGTTIHWPLQDRAHPLRGTKR